MRVPSLQLALAAACGVAAQHVVPYDNPLVPKGVPIQGNYTGPLRPQVHFSPPKGFMNDPNGMFVDHCGVWHLYYQYNPTGIAAGNQHWGHATSTNLYHWTNQPIALFPPEERVYVFSGSAVIDKDNTSGFFPNQTNGVVAIFTLARYYEDGTGGPQQQAIAYSTDGGYSFLYYDGNPVISSTSSQFRDPKVVRYNDKWVMVVSYAQEFTLGFFTSDDLKTWTHASNFSNHGLLGAQYECPNLVQMPVRDGIGPDAKVVDTAWVLSLSVQPGAPLGGSVTQYFPGDFNGTHFVPWDDATRLTDFAKDNYAGQFFYGLGDNDNAVSMGWASNWQYAQVVPTGNLEGWRSSMTMPRVHYLAKAPRIGWVMVNRNVDMTPILNGQAPLSKKTWPGNSDLTLDYSAVPSGALVIDVSVSGLNASTITGTTTLNVTFTSQNANETLRTGFFFGGDNPFFIDRGDVYGFDGNVFFTDKFSVADVWNMDAGEWEVRVVIDRSLLEVYVDGGVHAGTATFFPESPMTGLTVGTAGMADEASTTVTVSALYGGWS